MSSWLSRAKPACTGYDGLFLQRPLFRSSREARHSQRSVDRNYGDRAFIAVLRYICSYPPCRARPSLPVECRPKFISVASWGVRFRECSTPSIRFNLCENCYKSGMHRLPSGESPRRGEARLRGTESCAPLQERERRRLRCARLRRAPRQRRSSPAGASTRSGRAYGD
jgi:hypothetical protein